VEDSIKLPLIHAEDKDLNMVQTKWKSLIDPIISNQLIDGHVLYGIKLSIGSNNINHLLGRNLLGYIIVGIDGLAEIYDSQASNQQKNLTLILVSNAAVTANIYVF